MSTHLSARARGLAVLTRCSSLYTSFSMLLPYLRLSGVLEGVVSGLSSIAEEEAFFLLILWCRYPSSIGCGVASDARRV